jgi:hypothetical protein
MYLIFTLMYVVISVYYVLSYTVSVIIFFNLMGNLFSFDEFSLNERLFREPSRFVKREICVIKVKSHTLLWYELLKYGTIKI